MWVPLISVFHYQVISESHLLVNLSAMQKHSHSCICTFTVYCLTIATITTLQFSLHSNSSCWFAVLNKTMLHWKFAYINNLLSEMTCFMNATISLYRNWRWNTTPKGNMLRWKFAYINNLLTLKWLALFECNHQLVQYWRSNVWVCCITSAWCNLHSFGDMNCWWHANISGDSSLYQPTIGFTCFHQWPVTYGLTLGSETRSQISIAKGDETLIPGIHQRREEAYIYTHTHINIYILYINKACQRKSKTHTPWSQRCICAPKHLTVTCTAGTSADSKNCRSSHIKYIQDKQLEQAQNQRNSHKTNNAHLRTSNPTWPGPNKQHAKAKNPPSYQSSITQK